MNNAKDPMLLRKNKQNVPEDLVFLETAILQKAGTKILSVFNRLTTFDKHLETSVFDESFQKRQQKMQKNFFARKSSQNIPKN